MLRRWILCSEFRSLSPRDIEILAPCTSPEEAKRIAGSLRVSPLSISFVLHAVYNAYRGLLLSLFDCSVDSGSLVSCSMQNLVMQRSTEVLSHLDILAPLSKLLTFPCLASFHYHVAIKFSERMYTFA